LTTTTYPSPSEPSVNVTAKGSETLPSIRTFLSHLGIPILEPTTEVFRSACAGAGSSAGNGGIPGIEAYRAAKQGNLWFMKEGILWGEGKPCEFWSVEDLIGKSEGLRMVSATGRTCAVVLTRKSDAEVDGEVGEDEEDVGVETEFGLVDAREQEGISQWVRQHRHLFGKKPVVVNGQASGSGNAVTINNVEDDSDEDDEDFEVDSGDEDGGSATSSDSSGDENGGGGSGGDAEESGEGSESEDGDGEEEDEELKAENHPLMRPGAMPRISRAAIDMVVGMVEDDFMGPEREDEEDELED
jgi:AAA ATPase containing von Willebrand factor type A (vWA) domain